MNSADLSVTHRPPAALRLLNPDDHDETQRPSVLLIGACSVLSVSDCPPTHEDVLPPQALRLTRSANDATHLRPTDLYDGTPPLPLFAQADDGDDDTSCDRCGGSFSSDGESLGDTATLGGWSLRASEQSDPSRFPIPHIPIPCRRREELGQSISRARILSRFASSAAPHSSCTPDAALPDHVRVGAGNAHAQHAPAGSTQGSSLRARLFARDRSSTTSCQVSAARAELPGDGVVDVDHTHTESTPGLPRVRARIQEARQKDQAQQ